jgi:type IV secretion system protein VirD4
MPQQPLFSPIYSSTRPYSISRSATQRMLMMPDEIMQMDNKECLVLIRGRRPLRLKKIIVEELPEYPLLKPCRVVEHEPSWRDAEAEAERKRQEQAATEAAAKALIVEPEIETVTSKKKASGMSPECPDQQSFYDITGQVPETAGQPAAPVGVTADSVIETGAHGDDSDRKEDMPYVPGETPGEMDEEAFSLWLMKQQQAGNIYGNGNNNR